MSKYDLKVSNYSPHLFWDVDKRTLILDDRKTFLVGRVLDYGVMSDWKQLVKDLGLDEVGTIALNLKSLDPKSLSFMARIIGKEEKCFRSYNTIQLNKIHWVY